MLHVLPTGNWLAPCMLLLSILAYLGALSSHLICMRILRSFHSETVSLLRLWLGVYFWQVSNLFTSLLDFLSNFPALQFNLFLVFFPRPEFWLAWQRNEFFTYLFLVGSFGKYYLTNRYAGEPHYQEELGAWCCMHEGNKVALRRSLAITVVGLECEYLLTLGLCVSDAVNLIHLISCGSRSPEGDGCPRLTKPWKVSAEA